MTAVSVEAKSQKTGSPHLVSDDLDSLPLGQFLAGICLDFRLHICPLDGLISDRLGVIIKTDIVMTFDKYTDDIWALWLLNSVQMFEPL